MEKNGKVYINNANLKEEFLRLNLNGKRPDLEKALSIFQLRINERYLSPIKKLNSNVFSNGFASMALCCLLIDTFYQFEHGVKETSKNHDCYVRFLRGQLGDVFDTQEKAERFYKDIRCGILHSAQTYGGSRLSCDQESIIVLLDDSEDSPISVDVKKLVGRLTDYFNEYCDRVRNNKTTQSNFVKKLKIMFS